MMPKPPKTIIIRKITDENTTVLANVYVIFCKIYASFFAQFHFLSNFASVKEMIELE